MLLNPSDAVHVQIKPLVILPVGENLQSHAGPGGLYFTFKTKSGLYPPRVLTVDLATHLSNYIKNGEGESVVHAARDVFRTSRSPISY